MSEAAEPSEKKKPDSGQVKKAEEDLPLPSKSEIIRQEINVSEKGAANQELYIRKT